MPIYEYICQDCGEKYEKLVRSLKAKVELTCPQCGSQHAKKVISVFGAAIGAGSGASSAGSKVSAPAAACGPVG
ncbi:MAG: zinc ribbon domain-containing protein [Anaerolineae bacterium]|nr:zinc ribbon domain-containing protein [Anaerolineae bacterium]